MWHGLYKYFQLTEDPKVKLALSRHARAVRDNPPWNHEYESFFSSIHSLLVGYELSGEPSFLETAIKRSASLKTDPLASDFEKLGSQGEIAMALTKASNLPEKIPYNEGAWLNVTIWGPTQGLRIFGWTHAYNIPYLVFWLQKESAAND